MNTTSDHDDLPESFSPATVDDEIARYLSAEPQPTGTARDAHLIHTLATYHTLPPAADASLVNVRARLRDSLEALGASSGSSTRRATSGDPQARRDAHPHAQPQQRRATMPPASPTRRPPLLSAPLRALAAVLVVALLVGGFVAVLHLRGGRQIAASPAWQNVAITHANTQGHALDFDPTQVRVEYAISQVDGTIYALGDTHLWYSVNGGATYQPFATALPLVKGGPPYAISTVPGLRGVFLSSGNQPSVTIDYAEVGDSSWRQLNISNVAQPVIQSGNSVPFDATDIGKAIFYEHDYGKSIQARAVGNWLFILAGRSGASGSTLIGTPDFGATWYALTTTLPATCMRFAVSPADARQLFCLTSGNAVEQSIDGGLTWRPLVSANGNSMSLYTSLWASRQAIYSYTTGGVEQTALARRPIGSGDWSAAATLPTLPEGGSSEIIGVSPGDTVYAVAALEGQQTRVRISALTSGARQFAPIGNEATLTLPNSAIFFDLGDLYSSNTPAIYAHVAPSAQVAGPLPLYRLAAPQPVVTPFTTPTSLPTATPTLHGPCASAPGDVANIPSGGYGANIDTFEPRWGPSAGVAGGSVYFGRWADGTPKMRVADTMPSNNRVYAMGYTADKAQDMTLAQGEALAASILPRDATSRARAQQGNDITVTYCSAALIAAFPASVQDINGPLPHNGLVVVTYTLRADGHLFGIGFGPLP